MNPPPPTRRPSLKFAAAFVALFGWLLLLESPHLGVNAALHWDAEASITWGPAVGTRAELAAARAHLFDVLPRVGSTDPQRVTAYYWSDAGLAYHEPLTRCRYYYSWASDLLGHAAFAAGRRAFATPTAAVLCYQLAAMAMVAAGLAAMAARCGGPRRSAVMAAVTFAAVASSPTMLSLARQVLQETPGFALAAAAVVAFTAGAGRSSVVALSAAGAAGFAAVRCRYTLAPMLALLLPLAWGLTDPAPGRPRRRPWVLPLAFAAPPLVLLAADLVRFGPFALPGVYDDVMVRSARLFFHADRPYDDFLVAAFVNATLLVLPAMGVWCWATDGRGRPAWRAYALLVMAVLFALLWRTAAQQVRYQPRHLFAVADGLLMLWLLVLPRVRWRPAPALLYGTVAAFFTVWNVCSTFGSQRLHSIAKVPDVVTVVARHLGEAGATDRHSLGRDLWPAYFDWADSRLLHDTLIAWTYLHARPRRPTVAIDAAAATANQMMLYARSFPAFDWRMMRGGRGDADVLRGADYLLTAPGRRPPTGVAVVGLPSPLDLMHVALRPITAVSAAAVVLDAGAAPSATAGGLTIRRAHGRPGRFDGRHGYLPRVQQEWLTYDGDADHVEYDIAGLRPDRAYTLGFVTWDPDAVGRVMAVDVDGTTVLPHVVLARSEAPTDATVPLPPGTRRVTFRNVGTAGVAVCEVWVCERMGG